MTGVNQLLAVVTLVVQMQNGQPIGKATGFFYARDSTIYLVTNKHVVMDEQRGVKPDILRVRLHTDASDLSKNADFDIPLYSQGLPTWHTHPDYATKEIDVAVVEVDQRALKGGHSFKTLSASHFLPKQYVVTPGEDVMVIGFPLGMSDSKHNLPLIRSAMISSAYGVDFQGAPFFLVDANLHQGTSGSPVLTKPKNIWLDDKGNTNVLTGMPIYFLGVHSATVELKLPSGTEPLGLGTVWYAYLIEEIIDSFQPK